jgi:broad specificity phosphatase PhoE
MRIFLMRHGRSEANEEKKMLLHKPDHSVNLSALGHEQAKESGAFLAKYLKANPGKRRVRIWNSSYWRTRQTADNVEAEFLKSKFSNNLADFNQYEGQVNKKIFFDRKESPLIVEQQFGLFDGYEDEELQEKFPLEFANFNKNQDMEGRYYARMPMGESRFDVSIRVHQFFGSLLRDYETKGIDDLVIVSHGVTLRAFVMMWLHKSPEWFDKEQNPTNCSIQLIEGDRGDYEYQGYLIGSAGWNESKIKGR